MLAVTPVVWWVGRLFPKTEKKLLKILIYKKDQFCGYGLKGQKIRIKILGFRWRGRGRRTFAEERGAGGGANSDVLELCIMRTFSYLSEFCSQPGSTLTYTSIGHFDHFRGSRCYQQPEQKILQKKIHGPDHFDLVVFSLHGLIKAIVWIKLAKYCVKTSIFSSISLFISKS